MLLRHAVVNLFGEDLQGGRSTSTDENGRYEIKDLPASRIQASASKGGYATVNYGQRRALQPGRLLDLANGQTLELDFNLPRGAVISGRVTDDFNEPAVGIRVSAARWSYMNGKRQLVPAGMASSDDLGRFRIYGLPAGDYYVMASAGNMNPFQMGQSDAQTGFGTTYYPGTLSTTDAIRVRVPPGGENATANFTLIPARAAKISGTVVDSTGRPVATGWLMMVETSGPGMFNMSPGGEIHDGTFSVPSVAPGEYRLSLQVGSDSSPERESAYVPINVAGVDITDLAIVLSKGSRITGQLTFESAPPSEKRMSAFTMWTHAPDPSMIFIGGGDHATR